MGQRLVITVEKNDKKLAKIYYHWSAYTVCALCEAKKLLEGIGQCGNMTNKELQLQLIRFCEENGGGIDGGSESQEFKWITEMFPGEKFKEENINRSNGLIAISKEGMREIQEWSEGDIIINLDTNRLSNWVYYSFDNIEDYNHYRVNDCEEEKVKEEDITKIEKDLSGIKLCDLDDVINELNCLSGWVCRSNGRIYELIV